MSTFLEEKEVNLVNLSLELEQAALEHTVQDHQKIYVFEGGTFPFWLQIYPEPHVLFFNTYFDLDATMSVAEHYAFCNCFNSKSLMPGIHFHKNRLYADYAMSYRDGLIRNQFIRTCRNFAHEVDRARGKLAAFSDGTYADDDQQ